MNKKIIFLGLAGLLSSLLSTSAHAVASMSFSGGSGSPYVFTLNQSVEYEITTAPTATGPLFVFKGVGDVFLLSEDEFDVPVSGTMTYSVNGGPMLTLDFANSGFEQGDVLPADMVFGGPAIYDTDPVGWLKVGDVDRLLSGTLTTTGTFLSALPADADFSTFMVDNYLNRISDYGVSVTAVPEPETYALMLAGLAVVGAAARRRKAK